MSPDSTTPSTTPDTATPPFVFVEVVRLLAVGKTLTVRYDADEITIRRLIRRLNNL